MLCCDFVPSIITWHGCCRFWGGRIENDASRRHRWVPPRKAIADFQNSVEEWLVPAFMMVGKMKATLHQSCRDRRHRGLAEDGGEGSQATVGKKHKQLKRKGKMGKIGKKQGFWVID